MALSKNRSEESNKVEEVDIENFESEVLDDPYMISDSKSCELLKSGCTLLDRVLGGGYPIGRMVNIVGDRSSGKTLLAIEALANFQMQYPESKDGQWYNEAEAAFDEGYAQSLGLNTDDIKFVCSEKDPTETFVDDANHTVEGLCEHLEKVLQYHQKHNIKRGIYIVDSMDAFSDRSELKREIDGATYGANKPKKIGEMFRRLVRRLEAANILLLIISQVRENIGVTFGEKYTRSGGKALDFYASQILWLAEIGKVKKTIQGIERPVAVNVRARCKKNKVGLPFRECDYSVEFGYGIDDLTSNVEFLMKTNSDWLSETPELNMTKTTYKRRISALKDGDNDTFKSVSNMINLQVVKEWNRIEKSFMPTRRKYS